jgi:oxygen-dependent protoporphyrinogen oxidase
VAVVGGGIAGLAAAWTLRRHAVETGRAVEVRLFEAAPRLGGKIATERHGGFLVEAGPDSFVTRKPEAVELARELGLGERLVATDVRHHRVWMVRRGRLAEIPPELGHVLPCRLAPVWSSDLLSWRGKLRLALDLVLPRRRAAGDESLGAFLRRRFGDEMVDRLAGPLLAGIYVADPENLSLAATFPHLAEIERRHGSVIRGLRAAGAHQAHAPSPASRVSLVGGVGELVEALVATLRVGGGEEEGNGTAAAKKGGVRLHTGCAVRRLEARADGGWLLHLAEVPGEAAGGDDAATEEQPAAAAPGDLEDRFAADAVVLALPAGAAAALLASIAASVSATLAAIPHVSTATVTLGYRRADLPRPLDGFGFVVPAAEGRRITACTWSSAKFLGRAAADHALLRAFLGGPRGERWLEGDDDALVAHARHELADLMGLDAAPILTAVHRHPAGTPQYQVGHADRIAAAEAALPAGLHLAGSPYHGIGIPDCIKSGQRAAERVLQRIA